ncbi:hypothetical protein K7711_09050 [Nocardia sp. CA2R105]|uniref:hypothetical protein n=1 Tax=Nocardia coffeae TaxID=2873381 RepID=UPI001CA64C4F|nr:hypothetical protein [Nocardia coffeae]MBY8856620.1 hypothetical protein [Nocardia coffeae]
MSALIGRIEQLQGELAAIVTDVGTVVASITNPEALTREIISIERDAELKMAAIERAKAGAERAAEVMSRRLGEVTELEALAAAAAEESGAVAKEAIERAERIATTAVEETAAARADLDQVRIECDRTVRQQRERCERALTAQADAEDERDSAIAKAHADAEELAALRQRLSEQEQQHRQQLEARDIEYARAITAAHAMADRAAREQREQVNQILDSYSAGGPRIPESTRK